MTDPARTDALLDALIARARRGDGALAWLLDALVGAEGGATIAVQVRREVVAGWRAQRSRADRRAPWTE